MTKINIELIYPLPQEQILWNLEIDDSSTIEEVIRISGILEKYPEIDLDKNKVGVFSKVIKLNETLREGDRIEIYRALIADPKEARKKKAVKQKEK